MKGSGYVEVQRSSHSSERTCCPSYFSRDFSQRANERSEFSLISTSPLSFPFVTFLRPSLSSTREWENRLNISEHFRTPCRDTFYLSPPPVSYSISLSRRGWKTYIFRTTITIGAIQRAMQNATIRILNKRSFNERNGQLVSLSLSLSTGTSFYSSAQRHRVLSENFARIKHQAHITTRYTYIHCTLVHMPSKSRSDLSHW